MASPDAFSLARAVRDIQGRKAAIESAINTQGPSTPAPVETSPPKKQVQPSSYAPSGAPKQTSYGAPMGTPSMSAEEAARHAEQIKGFINEMVPIRKMQQGTQVQQAKIK